MEIGFAPLTTKVTSKRILIVATLHLFGCVVAIPLIWPLHHPTLNHRLPQYSLLRDIYEHIPSRKPTFKGTEYFGQLKKILVVGVPSGAIPAITHPGKVALAIIGPRETANETSLGIPHYTEPTKVTPRAVDINTVMCLVGRIRDRGRWAIIDRSGDMARAEFIE